MKNQPNNFFFCPTHQIFNQLSNYMIHLNHSMPTFDHSCNQTHTRIWATASFVIRVKKFFQLQFSLYSLCCRYLFENVFDDLKSRNIYEEWFSDRYILYSASTAYLDPSNRCLVTDNSKEIFQLSFQKQNGLAIVCFNFWINENLHLKTSFRSGEFFIFTISNFTWIYLSWRLKYSN